MVVSQSLSSKKYATAFVNVYQDSLTLEDVQVMMKASVFLQRHQSIMLLICSAGLKKQDKFKIIAMLCKHFNMHESLEKFLELLLKKKNDICLLPEILQDICYLYKKRNNILDLQIKSAEPLDQESVEVFKKFFAQQSQKDIIATTQTDTSLIAGVRLQSTTFLWEYSVASRLRALRQKFFIEG